MTSLFEQAVNAAAAAIARKITFFLPHQARCEMYRKENGSWLYLREDYASEQGR